MTTRTTSSTSGKFWKIFTCFVTLLHPNISTKSPSPLPVVMWHAWTGYSQEPIVLGPLMKLIKEKIPHIQVTSVATSDNSIQEIADSILIPLSDQIDLVCKKLKKDPSLKNGYNAIGHSQGALLFRALAQRCPDPPIVNLISLVGPQQGVYGIPNCPPSLPMCERLRGIISPIAYRYLQKWFTVSQLWHDPINEQSYIEKNSFLPDINCETGTREEYRKNILQLKNLVLVKAINETSVIPKESEWFGFYKSGQSKEIYKLEDSPMYKEDCLGFKTLNETGRLHLIEKEGGHLDFPDQWVITNIIEPFLKPRL